MNYYNKRFVLTIIAIIVLMITNVIALPADTGSRTPPPAQELLDQAIKSAKAENKAIFVHFGASWCGFCKRLDAFLQAPQVGKMMTDNYVLVSLVVKESREKKALENPGAMELMKKMGGVDIGLPFFFFMDQEGKKLADSLALPNRENIGYPSSKAEIKAFDKLLEQTAPRMTSADRAAIADYLAKNASHR